MAALKQGNKWAFAALMLEGFLTRFGFGMVAFALPLYAYSLGMSIASIGLLMTINLGVSAGTKLIFAGVVDRMGCRRAAVIATLVRAMALVMLIMAATPWALYGIQILRGLAKSMRDPALNVLIASYGGKKSLARAFAWYGTAKSTAVSLGRAVAGILLGLWAGLYDQIFALALIPVVLPIFLLLIFIKEVKVVKPTANQILPSNHGTTMKIVHDLWPVLGFGFTVSATGRMLHGLLPILAVKYAGLNEAVVGGLYLFSAIIMSVSAPMFGWLSDRVSRKLVLAVRGVANGVASLLYVVMPTPIGFYLGKAFDSLGAAAFKPAWGVMLAEAALPRREHQARVMSIMGASRDAGAIVGPVIGGVLWSLFGPVPMLLTRAALALGTELYALIIIGHLPAATGLDKPDEHRLRNNSE